MEDMKNMNMEEQTAEEQTAEEQTAEEQQEEEMREEQKEAQKKGIVNMNDKKPKEESGNYTHYFRKPEIIGGKTYKSLTFYFERLCGEDIEAIEEELQVQNKYVLSPEISSTFQSMLAARAAGVASDEIRRLKVYDYMKIKNKARDFLVNMGY